MNVNSTTSAPLQNPEYVAARVAELAEGLKNLDTTNNGVKSQNLWEMYGVEIQIAKDHAEGVELAKQGIPSKVWEFEGYTFIPAMLFKGIHDAKKREEDAIKRVEATEAIERTNLRLVTEDTDRLQFIKENNRLKSVTDMLRTPEIDWLVQDKVHRTGLFQLFGASYAGKTLVTLDLVMSWCAGLPEWQGYKLCNDGKPQDAVYVAAEGGAAVSVHVDAWLKYHPEVDRSSLKGLVFLDGGDGDHMFLSVGKEGVEDADSWDRLKNEIASLEIAPSLVVFDTQIDLAPGVDENSNTDMVGVLRRVKRMGDEYGFMAMVIHHTGHDGNKARGASGMMGKCDAQAKLTVIGTENTGRAKLEWTKVKGRAVPKDSISYHIQGTEFLPDLDSEGAVCVPISKIAAHHADISSKRPAKDLQDKIMLAIGQETLSIRALADAVQLDRGTSEFKNAIEWMEFSAMIEIDKTNSKAHKIRLAPFAVAPSGSDLN